MAEGGSTSTAAAGAPPPCCGLARLVRRLRRQGRRALRAASHSHRSRRHRATSCRQYDPLSYARNFDHGRDADADDARVYYACSFSSRFALGPSAVGAGASAAPAGLPLPVVATS